MRNSDEEDEDTLTAEVHALVEKMDKDPKVRDAIRAHLRRQRGVEYGFVKLDDERVVRIGEEAEE